MNFLYGGLVGNEGAGGIFNLIPNTEFIDYNSVFSGKLFINLDLIGFGALEGGAFYCDSCKLTLINSKISLGIA